jgi:hypothetical protein
MHITTLVGGTTVGCEDGFLTINGRPRQRVADATPDDQGRIYMGDATPPLRLSHASAAKLMKAAGNPPANVRVAPRDPIRGYEMP